MDTRPTFIAHVEPAKSMQPRQRPLDDPTRPAKPAAVRRSTLRKLGPDAAPLEFVAMRLRIISTVALNQTGLAPRAAGASPQRRNGVSCGPCARAPDATRFLASPLSRHRRAGAPRRGAREAVLPHHAAATLAGPRVPLELPR